MHNPSIAREASHFVRNLDSLVRLRHVLGDDQEETIDLLKERGADDYLIGLLVPERAQEADAVQIGAESRRLFARASAAMEEIGRQRQTMRRLIGEGKEIRQRLVKKPPN